MISPDCPVSALCFPRTPCLEETTFICGTTAKLSSPQCLEKGELLRSPHDHKEIETPKGFSEDLPCPYKVPSAAIWLLNREERLWEPDGVSLAPNPAVLPSGRAPAFTWSEFVFPQMTAATLAVPEGCRCVLWETSLVFLMHPSDSTRPCVHLSVVLSGLYLKSIHLMVLKPSEKAPWAKPR